MFPARENAHCIVGRLLPSAIVMIGDGYSVRYDVFEINVHDDLYDY